MAYTINFSDAVNKGNIVVEDQTLNTDTSLTLVGRNKTAKADANAGAGAGASKPKITKYTTGTTTLKLGGKTNPNPIKGRAPGYDF